MAEAQNSTASTPSNVTPLHSLFLSTTRPVSAPSKSTNRSVPQEKSTVPSYQILLQTGLPFHQRITAAHPQDDADLRVYQTVGINSPKEISSNNSCGLLLLTECWKECVKLCQGHVIWVSTCNSVTFSKTGRDAELWRLFETNGVFVDLHTNPLGWDEEEQKMPAQADRKSEANSKVVHGKLTSFQSIYSCIKSACSEIQSKLESSGKPIPIIFESMTPLLLYHGIDKLSRFLAFLKQDSRNCLSFPSPIVIPVSIESLNPFSHRLLEDLSDAVLTLVAGRLEIAKRSARYGGNIGGLSGARLVKDVQVFEVEGDRGMHIRCISKGGSQHKSSKQNGEDEGIEDSISNIEGINISPSKEETSSSLQQKKGLGSKNPILQHEGEEGRLRPEITGSKPAPHIFMEENDPEFDDLDEEDPDDDLDI
jgi:hypothetical protein